MNKAIAAFVWSSRKSHRLVRIRMHDEWPWKLGRSLPDVVKFCGNASGNNVTVNTSRHFRGKSYHVTNEHSKMWRLPNV